MDDVHDSRDATQAELELIYRIFGPKPTCMTPEQWKENTRSIAQDIRDHVDSSDLVKELREKIKGLEYIIKQDLVEIKDTEPEIIDKTSKHYNTPSDFGGLFGNISGKFDENKEAHILLHSSSYVNATYLPNVLYYPFRLEYGDYTIFLHCKQ